MCVYFALVVDKNSKLFSFRQRDNAARIWYVYVEMTRMNALKVSRDITRNFFAFHGKLFDAKKKVAVFFFSTSESFQYYTDLITQIN